MDVIHGPPRFEFADPPFRHSLPMTLSFAATASRPTAVLTGPLHLVGGPARSLPQPWWPGAATCRTTCSKFSSTRPIVISQSLEEVTEVGQVDSPVIPRGDDDPQFSGNDLERTFTGPVRSIVR
jgi:hypothetical protein